MALNSITTILEDPNVTPEELKHSEEYKQFLLINVAQLQSIGLPSELYAQAFVKMRDDQFDAGEYYVFKPRRDGELKYEVFTKKAMKANQDLVLLDHVYTTYAHKFISQVKKFKRVREACMEVLNIDETDVKGVDPVPITKYEDDPYPSQDILHYQELKHPVDGFVVDLSTNGLEEIPREVKNVNVVALNLSGNNFTSLETLTQKFKCAEIRNLDLRDTPLQHLKEEVMKEFPKLEIFNGRLLPSYTKWAILDRSNAANSEEVLSLNLENMDIEIWKPEAFESFQNIVELKLKGNIVTDEFIDSIAKSFPKLSDIHVNWKYQKMVHSSQSKFKSLKYVNYVAISEDSSPPTEIDLLAAIIEKRAWKYFETYTLPAMSPIPLWYLMDQLGISISDSKEPNVKVAPFYNPEKTQCFSLCWHTKDTEQDSLVTRDFLYGRSDVYRNVFRLIDDLEQPFSKPKLPSLDLPTLSLNPKYKLLPKMDKKEIKLCTDSKAIRLALMDPKEGDINFTFTELEESDVIWAVYAVPEFSLKPNQFYNKFAFEGRLLQKPQFSTLSEHQPWAIETYALGNDRSLYAWLYRYLELRKNAGYNSWIIKALHAPQEGHYVSNDVSCVLKWTLSSQRDIAVVSRYVDQPLLFNFKKFVLRYLVLVDEIFPEVKVLVYDKMGCIVAKEIYDPSDYHDNEKHLTTEFVDCEDFIEEWKKDEDQPCWDELQKKIRVTLRKLFDHFGRFLPHPDLHEAGQIKAIYQVDLLIEQPLNPKILDVSGCQDLSLWLKNDNFYREAFEYLFAGRESEHIQSI